MKRRLPFGFFSRFMCKKATFGWGGSTLFKAVMLVCMLLSVMTLSACGGEGNNAKVIFTTGFGKDDVFRIGNEVCTVPEIMVYLTNTGNQYESVYGDEVWKISLEGVTLEENIKETVLAKIAQIKTMCLLAGERGVVLEEEENQRVKDAAAEYFDSLNESEKALMGVTIDIVEQLYREYVLADKVYQYIIQDVRPEISDDEARTITIQHILLRTYTVDQEGGREVFSDKVRQSIYEKACEIRQKVVDGEADFVDMASRFSEDSTITYSFRKGEADAIIEKAAFLLETGEVSEVIETENGYHILKCVSTFDREQTDRNKLVIIEEKRREIFGQEYDAFVQGLARQLNTKLWDEIVLLHDENVTTTSFFEVYAKYFSH